MAEKVEKAESAGKKDPLEVAVALRIKLRSFQQRIDKITAAKDQVRPTVFAKVHRDYEEKLHKIRDEFENVRQLLRGDLNRVRELLAEREQGLDRLNEQWEEFSLRFTAGQYSFDQKAQVEEKYLQEHEKLQEVVDVLRELVSAGGSSSPSNRTTEIKSDPKAKHAAPAAPHTAPPAPAPPAEPKPSDATGRFAVPKPSVKMMTGHDASKTPTQPPGASPVPKEQQSPFAKEQPAPAEKAPAKPSAASDPKRDTGGGDTVLGMMPEELEAMRREAEGKQEQKHAGEGQYTRMQKLADIFGTDDLSALEEMQPSSPDSGGKLPVLIFHSGMLAGTRFVVNKTRITIGRVRDNDIQIEKDTSISRYHAEINRVGVTYLLKDLNSANGSVLNGAIVKGSATLKNGDLVTIGETEFVFISDPRDPRAEE